MELCSKDLSFVLSQVSNALTEKVSESSSALEDEYTKVAGIYKLTAADLAGAKGEMIVMHPLPRVNEISPDVDETRHARYFEQAFNGVVARMALMCRLLGVTIPGGEA